MKRVEKILHTRPVWIISALYVVCLSVIAGIEQPDSNWDLLNYHFYVAHAFWTGHLDKDLAAAGLMSYTNPLIDMPYYLLQHVLNAPHLAAAVLGLLQALAFPLVWWAARMMLPRQTQDNYPLLAVFLALAGTLVPFPLSLLGTTFGDMITVPLVVGAVCLVLKGWESPSSFVLFAGAGLCLGVATGLKLTNATYVVSLGLCVLLLRPAHFWARLQSTVLLGVGTVTGFMPTGGWWMIHLYRTFGNPLFPLYSKYFPNPLTLPTGSMATGFGPHSIWKFIELPWTMAFNPEHAYVGNEFHFHAFLWPVFFTLFILLGLSLVLKRPVQADIRAEQSRAEQSRAEQSRAGFIVAFVALSFLVWSVQFSILRYLTSAEALLPLAVYIVGSRLPAGRWCVTVGTLAVAFGALAMWARDGNGLANWGRGAKWIRPLISVDTPYIVDPVHTTVILFPPLSDSWPSFSWMVPFFPEKLAFAMISDTIPATGTLPDFPASEAYFDSIHKMARSRGGAIYAMVGGAFRPEMLTVSEQQKQMHKHLMRAEHALEERGFEIDTSQCQTHSARLTTWLWTYQWCPVAELNSE